MREIIVINQIMELRKKVRFVIAYLNGIECYLYDDIFLYIERQG